MPHTHLDTEPAVLYNVSSVQMSVEKRGGRNRQPPRIFLPCYSGMIW